MCFCCHPFYSSALLLPPYSTSSSSFCLFLIVSLFLLILPPPHSTSSSLYLFHASSNPFLGGPSVWLLAYSSGIPASLPFSIPRSKSLLPPQTPLFVIAWWYNFPPSPTPSLNSSQARHMEAYWRSSSKFSADRRLSLCIWYARWMVQCLKARRRENRRGRGTRVIGWWRQYRIKATHISSDWR